MRKKVVLCIGAICALLVGFFVWLFVAYRQPVYQGKALNQWVDEYNDRADAPSSQALVHIGKAAAPWLSRRLRTRDTPQKTSVVQWFAGHPKVARLFEKQSWFQTFMRPASANQKLALSATSVLGLEVRETVPALANLLKDHPGPVDQANAVVAVNVLAEMGRDGIPPLLEALTNRSSAVRLRAAQMLGTAPGSGMAGVTAALQRCVSGNDLEMRDAATLALKLIANREARPLPPSATYWTQTAPTPGGGGRDVWNISQGTRLLSTSGLVPGFDARELFGANTPAQPNGEKGSVVFQDNLPDGFIHYLEWATASPVTLNSFGLIGASDGAGCSYQRSFRSFRLYARGNAAGPFSLVYSEEVPVPNPDGVYANVPVLFRNLPAPVTASQFRLEVMQNGSGPWNGPRLIRLFGFGGSLNPAAVAGAVQELAPDLQYVARLYLGDRIPKP